jgi:hypothetical protein
LANGASFDHLVGAREQGIGHGYAKRLGSVEINDEFVLGRRLHGQFGGLLALEDAIDVPGRAAALVDEIRPVGNQAARIGEATLVVDGGQLVAGCER